MSDYPSQVTNVKIETSSGDLYIKIPRNEIFRVDNIFSRHEYGISSHWLPKKPWMVIDIGANVGLFAIYIQLVNKASTIHCFEPVPSTVRLLQVNVAKMNNVHIHPFGLSNRSGSAQMSLHPGNTGENSLKYISCRDERSIVINLQDAAQTVTGLGVQHIDVLKIDTEGCEVEILQSLKPILNQVGLVMIEYHSDADRRAIDDLLAQFKLVSAQVVTPELGTLKYLNKKICEKN